MILSPGMRLGPYEIVAPLGEGGMGVVYKANDTRLGRTVALKFVKADFNQRWEREARAVAALNHPHIATLYDVGEYDGSPYLAMEYVKGAPLKGPRAVEEVIECGIQVADALAAAHAAGIVHRDLKPGNILVTEKGAVKVLDFGLAKLAEQSVDGTPASTQTVAISGTPGYISPEQLHGKAADTRSDVFAFGCVLYELASGRRAFPGETIAAALAATAMAEPERLEGLPEELERLIRRCLRKDPERRLQFIGDARVVLEDIRDDSRAGYVVGTGGVNTPSQVKARATSWVWKAATGLCLVLAAATTFLWLRHPGPDTRVTQFQISLPGDIDASCCGTAISPDGRLLVFSATTTGTTTFLWLRRLDSLEARMLAGTEGGHFPFWSQDGRSLAFFADGKLKRMDVAGGAPLILCEAPRGWGGAWSGEGAILFGGSDGIRRVSASGGTPARVTETDPSRQEVGHGFPQFLPGGRRFLYYVGSEQNTRGIYVGSVDNARERHKLLATDGKAIYTPPHDGRAGVLLWLREGTLMAQTLDASGLQLIGDPAPIANDVSWRDASGAFWTSDSGLLAYYSDLKATSRLVWMSRQGKRLEVAGPEDRYSDIRLSPDGTRAALERTDATNNSDIWVYDLGRRVMTRLTFDPAHDTNPVWSPDGRQIAFTRQSNGPAQIYRKNSGGGGQEEQLTNDLVGSLATDWSRDGRYILYNRGNPKAFSDLSALPLEGERKPITLLETPFNQHEGTFSPDGKWIAYASNESGTYQVYVRAFQESTSGAGGKWQVSINGGSWPFWRGDGKELFYLIFADNGWKVMAAGIQVRSDGIEAGACHELFTAQIFGIDVTADGQRFLVLEQATPASVSPLTVVLNWQAGLKK